MSVPMPDCTGIKFPDRGCVKDANTATGAIRGYHEPTPNTD